MILELALLSSETKSDLRDKSTEQNALATCLTTPKMLQKGNWLLGKGNEPMGGGEEDEFEVVDRVAMDFGVWEEGIAGDDHGRGIGTRTPLDGNAAGMWSVEAEEVGESAGRVLFDHGQGGRDFIGVDIGVESGEDEFGGEARGVGRGVEFAHEAAVPGIY